MLFGLEIALDVACTLALLIVSWLLTDKLPLYNRFTDLSYGYDQPVPKSESTLDMIIFIWIVPLAFVVIMHLIIRRNWKNTLLIMLTWFNVMSLAIFVTAFLRYMLPEARPYFLTKCAPTDGRVSGWLLDGDFCSNVMARHDVQSFPSGHTSLVWASWMYVILVLSYITATFDRKGGFWKLILFFLLPLLIPLWMSLDRIRSGHHASTDVFMGLAIGLLASVVGFVNMDAARLV